MLTDYLGECSEVKIKDHYVIVYEVSNVQRGREEREGGRGRRGREAGEEREGGRGRRGMIVRGGRECFAQKGTAVTKVARSKLWSCIAQQFACPPSYWRRWWTMASLWSQNAMC